MSRGRQIVRQWKILRALEGSRMGLSAKQMTDAIDEECSQRTVYRDLEQLQAAGFPLFEDDGCWRVLAQGEGGWSIPVQPTEVLVLALSEDLMAPVRGSYLAQPLRELRGRIFAMLTPDGRSYCRRIRDTAVATLFGAGDYVEQREELNAIREAIFGQRRLRIYYAPPRKTPADRVVEPYCTWYASGRVYLIAYCCKACDTRTFALQRIKSAEVLDERFDPDPDFDPARFSRLGFGVFHGSVYSVVIDFGPNVAHLIRERRYHQTQLVFEQGDGVRLHMEAAGLPEIAAWVAGFGDQALPIKPSELVEMVRQLHEKGLERLATEKTPTIDPG